MAAYHPSVAADADDRGCAARASSPALALANRAAVGCYESAFLIATTVIHVATIVGIVVGVVGFLWVRAGRY